MPASQHALSLHGVMIAIDGAGVLIRGPAASGKSSLALELLSQGHQLVADDVVELTLVNGHILGRSPAMLAGMLHSRELGLIDVGAVFGSQAISSRQRLHYLVDLDDSNMAPVSLPPLRLDDEILGQPFPLLKLSPRNPASLANRLLVWLKMQSCGQNAVAELSRRQQQLMSGDG